jgi:hypothetical protein
MQTTIHQQTYRHGTSQSLAHNSVWSRFIKWCEGQEENRFGWTAGILVDHGCVFTIVTMLAILMTGNNFIFWPFGIAAMGMCLVTNLAAMPTKITIPVFVLSLLIDLGIIIAAIAGSLAM